MINYIERKECCICHNKELLFEKRYMTMTQISDTLIYCIAQNAKCFILRLIPMHKPCLNCM